MRICFLFIFLIGWSAANADPITIDDSASPDGKYYLTIEETIDQYTNTTDTLQVRRTADKKIAGSFDWGQFGKTISPTSAHPIWSPDSLAFTLTWYMARGWTGTKVYASTGKNWKELTFPDYPKRFIGKNHIVGRGKGQFVPDKWISATILKMICEEGTAWDGQGQVPNLGDVDEDDWVYFQIARKSGVPTLRFQRLEARREHGYDL